MKKWMLLILALTVLVTGAISGLSFQSTLSGMRQVASGVPGTFVMQSDKLYMLAWPVKGGAWAFACLDQAGDPVKNVLQYVNGNKVDTLTMSNFVAQLEKDGWNYISSGALPAAVLNALKSYTWLMASIGMRSMPSPLIVPAIWLQPMTTPTGTIQ